MKILPVVGMLWVSSQCVSRWRDQGSRVPYNHNFTGQVMLLLETLYKKIHFMQWNQSQRNQSSKFLQKAYSHGHISPLRAMCY